MKTNSLMHRNGGAITDVFSFEHATHDGLADWYFVGRVEWVDGSKSERAKILPIMLHLKNEATGEVEHLLDIMEKYLTKNGTWVDGEWVPKKPSGHINIEARGEA